MHFLSTYKASSVKRTNQTPTRQQAPDLVGDGRDEDDIHKRAEKSFVCVRERERDEGDETFVGRTVPTSMKFPFTLRKENRPVTVGRMGSGLQ